jgi:hypothetical protein
MEELFQSNPHRTRIFNSDYVACPMRHRPVAITKHNAVTNYLASIQKQSSMETAMPSKLPVTVFFDRSPSA